MIKATVSYSIKVQCTDVSFNHKAVGVDACDAAEG